MTDHTRKIAQVLAGCLVVSMVSSSSAISAPASKPQLGCYRVGAEKGPSYIFCLRANSVLLSQRSAVTEGFGACGKFYTRPKNQLVFWWPNTAEGAFIHSEDWKKPSKVACTWSLENDGNLVLTSCPIAAVWTKTSDDKIVGPADQCDRKH